MFEEIIIGVFLASVPAVLWAVPEMRQRAGNWMAAWKTVPLGCLCVFFVPTLIYGIFEFIGARWELLAFRSSGLLFLGVTVAGLAVGIWLIVWLTRFIRRRYRAEERYSWVVFVLLFLLLGGGTIILSVAITMAQYSRSLGDPANYHGSWRTYRLPSEGGVGLAFEERSIHPFLAEYDYRLRFRRDGKNEYRDLQTNTGGRTFFNIYRLRDGRLYFTDKDHDYIVDAAKGEVLCVHHDKDKSYAAPYPEGKADSWGWSVSNGSATFLYGDHHIIALPVTDALTDASYYGCIRTDFHPAAEMPEQLVDKRFR